MKIPPKKPHFFKPIQPGFKNGLKIPIGFLKYLKGYDQHEHAILRRAGKKWMLKLNGHRFEEGWRKFAEEHNVQMGDMLVFRHEGNMEFEVSIFDSTHCDREYAEYMQIQEEDKDEDKDNEDEDKDNEDEDKDNEDEVQGGETSKKVEFNGKPNPCIKSSSRAFCDAEEVSTCFVFTVKPYCLKNGYFRLPKKFALENGFVGTCDLVIRDERQRSWNLRLTAYGSQVYILGGWKEFRVANGLKAGDHGMFEVVTDGEKPVWKFHASSPKPLGYSRFVCTIRSYCLSHDFLRIPKRFAHENGLINKKRDLIIRDERQKSWDLRLCYFGTSVCIKGGWNEFRDANCLKEGDRVMFEVVTNGEKPIWRFHGKKILEKMQASFQGIG